MESIIFANYYSSVKNQVVLAYNSNAWRFYSFYFFTLFYFHLKTFDDEIECDSTEEDRDEYADELTNLGHIARKCLPHVLNLMTDKYQSRIDMLLQLFNTQKQGKNIGILLILSFCLILLCSYILLVLG